MHHMFLQKCRKIEAKWHFISHIFFKIIWLGSVRLFILIDLLLCQLIDFSPSHYCIFLEMDFWNDHMKLYLSKSFFRHERDPLEQIQGRYQLPGFLSSSTLKQSRYRSWKASQSTLGFDLKREMKKDSESSTNLGRASNPWQRPWQPTSNLGASEFASIRQLWWQYLFSLKKYLSISPYMEYYQYKTDDTNFGIVEM